MKRLIFILGLVLIPIVLAHGNVLYNVDLDFDPELKMGVTNSAKDFLNIQDEPSKYDYDFELIIVKFGDDLEHSVHVFPTDFSIFGFRDDSLVSDGEVTVDADSRKNLAMEIYDLIPETHKSQLVYGGESKLYSGTFRHIWFRMVDGVNVMNDHLEVEIDPVDGDIVSWRLSPFFYQNLKVSPAISHQVAQMIAELRFDAQGMDKKPVLLFEKDRLVWLAKVKSLFPFFVGIDASDGKVLFSGSPRGELPKNYDYGRDVEIMQSSFINEIYGGSQ